LGRERPFKAHPCFAFPRLILPMTHVILFGSSPVLMMTAKLNLRLQVINIYKELLHLGQEYPLGYCYFRQRLHDVFHKNSTLTEEEDIQEAIKQARYVKKGLYFSL
ncbi:LYR motif-containing protein 5A, partial [Erysiphe necator]